MVSETYSTDPPYHKAAPYPGRAASLPHRTFSPYTCWTMRMWSVCWYSEPGMPKTRFDDAHGAKKVPTETMTQYLGPGPVWRDLVNSIAGQIAQSKTRCETQKRTKAGMPRRPPDAPRGPMAAQPLTTTLTELCGSDWGKTAVVMVVAVL